MPRQPEFRYKTGAGCSLLYCVDLATYEQKNTPFAPQACGLACKDDPGWQPSTRWPGWWVQCTAIRVVGSSRYFCATAARNTVQCDTGEPMVWISRSSILQGDRNDTRTAATVQVFRNSSGLLSPNHIVFCCMSFELSCHVRHSLGFRVPPLCILIKYAPRPPCAGELLQT